MAHLPPKATISRGLSLGPFGGRRGGAGGKVEPSDRDRGLAEARAGEGARGRGMVTSASAPRLDLRGNQLKTEGEEGEGHWLQP